MNRTQLSGSVIRAANRYLASRHVVAKYSAWKESEHPREASGSANGGQFASNAVSAAAKHIPDTMRKISDHADAGALVGAGDLRKATGMPKRMFDQLMHELAKAGIVSLHRHDFPSSLSEEKRAELIQIPNAYDEQPAGNPKGDKSGYFVGAAIRQKPAGKAKYSQGEHSPKGGVSIGGKFYPGGEFIPGSAIASATAEEKAAIEGKTKKTREGFEAVGKKTEQIQTKKGPQTRVTAFHHAEESHGQLPEELHARIKAMKLPPAWTGVQIANDPKSPLQAVGYDAKGREQRKYSAEHNAKKAKEKFERVKAFVKKLPGLRERLRADLHSDDKATREAAAVLTLIDATGFRVGSDTNTGAEKKAHGATTLLVDHAKVNGDTVTFDFVGKKGVDIHQTVKDPTIAAIVSARKQRGGKLFDTNASKVRDYLHSIAGDFKVKDFRTAVAGETALQAMQSIDPPTSEADLTKKRIEVGTLVSRKLGNTPTVALASYIPPEVFGSWQSNVMKNAKGFSKLSPSVSKQPAMTESRSTSSAEMRKAKIPTKAKTTNSGTSGGLPHKAAASYSLADQVTRAYYSLTHARD
jgi:DNA topoisomerase-1